MNVTHATRIEKGVRTIIAISQVRQR
jgi:hypothetical protein